MMTIVLGILLAVYGAFEALLCFKFLLRSRSSVDNATITVKKDLSCIEKATVAVIIPAWNDASVLRRSLDAVAPQIVASRASLVVVAGGSDGTYGEAKAWCDEHSECMMTLLPQEPHGKNAALNQGLRATSATYAVFLDADTAVCPGWLAALLEPLITDRADATTGAFSPFHRTPVSRIFIDHQIGAQVIRKEANLFGGGSIALGPRALTPRHLSEEVPVGVDHDLQLRLMVRGLRREYVPSAKVLTEIAESWREYWRNEVRWRRAHWYNVRHWRHTQLPGKHAVILPPLMAAIGWAGWIPGLLCIPVGLGPGIVLLELWAFLVLAISIRHLRTWFTVRLYVGKQGEASSWILFVAAFWISSAALLWSLATLSHRTAAFKGRRPKAFDPSFTAPTTASTEKRSLP